MHVLRTPSKSGSWRQWSVLTLRFAGAVAVLWMGLIHLHEYQGPYGTVPTIGKLFVVNFVTSTLIAVALLAPISGRWLALVTASGIGLAAGSFVMLLISEHGTLFGFHEPGYDPGGIALSRWVEIAAVIALGASLVLRFTPQERNRSR
jgi:hypothetical protein